MTRVSAWSGAGFGSSPAGQGLMAMCCVARPHPAHMHPPDPTRVMRSLASKTVLCALGLQNTSMAT